MLRKLPKISLVLRGKEDRNNKRLIYCRFAFDSKTNYISMGISVRVQDWDKKKSLVKPKDITAAKINQILSAFMLKSNDWTLEQYKNDQIPSYQRFRNFIDKKEQDKISVGDLLTCISMLVTQKVISASTATAYNAAVRNFMKVMPQVNNVFEIGIKCINDYKNLNAQNKNANVASQYARNLIIAIRHTCKQNGLDQPAELSKIGTQKVERLSEKKSLSQADYQKLKQRFFDTTDAQEKEVLRRFLVLCKGIRFSDTNRLKKDDLQLFEENGNRGWYFNIASQKTGVAGITLFFQNETMLLVFQKDGCMFVKDSSAKFNILLRKYSKQLIGREITSHYGRHYAAQQIIDSDVYDMDDVQAVLGIRDRNTAQIYAHRNVKKTLTKLLSQHEKDKTDRHHG